MNVSCSDLDADQSRLCAAIDALHSHWGTSDMRDAVSTLADATTRAADVLARLEPQLSTYPLAVQLQLRGLRTL